MKEKYFDLFSNSQSYLDAKNNIVITTKEYFDKLQPKTQESINKDEAVSTFIVKNYIDGVLDYNTYCSNDMGNAKFLMKWLKNNNNVLGVFGSDGDLYAYVKGIEHNGTTGGYWKCDDNYNNINRALNQIANIIASIIKDLFLQKNKLKNSEDQKKAYKNIIEKLQRRQNAYSNATSRKHIIDLLKAQLTDKYSDIELDGSNTLKLLSVQNGIIDLETGVIRSAKPDDYITRIAPVVFDRSVKSNFIDNFLLDISNNDKNVMRQMLQSIGASLNASQSLKKVFQFYGPSTNNGKTTAIEAFRNCLGEVDNGGYMMKMSVDALSIKNTSSLTPEMVGIEKARIATISELGKQNDFRLDKLKELTGGGQFCINPKYKQSKRVQVHLTFVIDTNYLITCHDMTMFDSGRFQIVPFDAVFDGKKCDPQIKSKLMEENAKTAMLNYIIDGCLDWKQNGMYISDRSKEYMENYKNNSDRIGDFLTQYYVQTHDKRDKIPVLDMFEAYKEYCKDNEYTVCGRTKFDEKISAHLDISVYHNKKIIRGIREKTESDDLQKKLTDYENSSEAFVANCCNHVQNDSQVLISEIKNRADMWAKTNGLKMTNIVDLIITLKKSGFSINDDGDTVYCVEFIDKIAEQVEYKNKREIIYINAVDIVKTIEDDKTRKLLLEMLNDKTFTLSAIDRAVGSDLVKLPF